MLEDHEAQIALDQALAAWNAAAARWDPEAFGAAYAEDAVIFGGRPGHSTGRDGVRAYFASYVAVVASGHLRLRDYQLFRLAPDVVLVQGYGCFELTFTNGDRASVVERATLTLVNRAPGWRVLQHHFSKTPAAPSLGQDLN